MKKYNQIVAVLLIILVSVSEATSLRRTQRITPMDELKNASEKSQFASNLFVTINLSLQSGGKVDEVIDFVHQAHLDAIQQRNDLTSAYNAESGRLHDELHDLELELALLNQQLEIVLENIDELEKEVSALENKLQRLLNERQGVEERRAALEQARENDMKAFTKRQIRDTNTINALEQIIPALENLRDNGTAFLEKSHSDILLALQRIPDNKPIQQLVQLSTKFNQAKLSEVIGKLTQVLENVMAAKASDEQKEQASIQHFRALQFECEALWQAKQNEVQETKTSLNAKQQSLRHNNNFRNDLTNNIEQTTNLRNSTQLILDQTTATYNTNLEAAQQAVDALKEALDILTENEATLEAQEQEAANEEANNVAFF